MTVGKKAVSVDGLKTVYDLQNSNIASKFNIDTNYAVGDYVIYQGRLYRFVITHAAGEWNNTHVVSVDVTSEIDAANGLVGNINMGTIATTVTGAIAEHESDINALNTKLGNIAMGTTATTVTGAIAEHEGDLSALNSSIDLTKAEALAAFSESSAGPADMLTVTDGADNIPLKSLTVAIEPKQDLHGYDHPWVGGAGKNLVCSTIAKIKEVNTQGTWTSDTAYKHNGITFTITSHDGVSIDAVKIGGMANSDAYFRLDSPRTDFPTGNLIANAGVVIPQGGGVYMGTSCVFADIYSGKFNNVTNTTDKQFTNDGSGKIEPALKVPNGSIESGGVLRPMIRLATEASSAYEPYSNICPITGWDEATVTRTGKNLLNPNAIGDVTTGNGTRQGVEFTIPGDYTISAQAAYTSNAGNIYVTKYDGSTYSNGAAIVNGSTKNNPFTNTITEGQKLIVHGGSGISAAIAEDVIEKCSIQLEYGSAATAYEPYTDNTLPISMKSISGSTVYGGTVTVNEDGTGTLVVDRAKVTLTGNESLAYSTNTKSFYHDAADTVPGIAGKEYTVAFDGVCDRFAPYDGVTAWANLAIACVGYVNAASPRLRFSIPGETEVTEAVRAKLAGTEVAYKLAAPVTYPLTATQLRTLLGNNILWCDAGHVTITYRQDTGLAIDAKADLLPIEEGSGSDAIQSPTCTASGDYSKAFGKDSTASGTYASAIGYDVIASGYASHAEGHHVTASGNYSHAEGSSQMAGNIVQVRTTSSGSGSHAEGLGTTATQNGSHAEGVATQALGNCSHAEGERTIARRESQHVFGKYNIEDTSGTGMGLGQYVEIVGNGDYQTRSNARTLDWSGNESLQGSLTLGKGTADEATVTAAQLKALLALLS